MAQKRRPVQRQFTARPSDPPRHIIVLVHGIRTFGAWQERLETLIRAADRDIEVIKYKYGYFDILAFVTLFCASR